MAVLGVMAALSTVLLILSTISTVNTVFFTVLASFFVGVAVVVYGAAYGFIFYIVCGLLDFLFNPNVLHVFLYMAMAGYLFLSELIWKKMPLKESRKKEWIHRGIRILLIVGLDISVLYFLPELFLAEGFLEKKWFVPMAVAVGFVLMFIYDIAYVMCKKFVFRHVHF